MEKTLLKLGLSPVEIKIYLILLRLGSSLAGNIAKKAEVNRSNCYDALQRLIEKGLVSYFVKENRRYFQATAPESLLTLVEDKRFKIEDELKNEKQEAEQIIDKLRRFSYLKIPEQRASIYQGKRGVKALWDDMIKTREEILILGVASEVSEIMRHHLDIFHKQRIKLKVPLKIILRESLRKTRGKELKKMKFTKIRFLPDTYASMSTTNIYGDKITIMLWAENPLGILVESKEIADSHRKNFNLFWKIAKK